jgi:hypothetical protein
MTIGYIGNFEPPYSTENDVRKAFESLGHKVIQLQENKIIDINTIPEVDLLLITGTWDSIPLLDWLDYIHLLALKNIPTATLHLDTFWNTSRGGRKWWTEVMFHTAYIFTADGDHQEKWKALGKNHIWLPPAVRYDATDKGVFNEQYSCDVAFVGSNGDGYHEDVWGYRKELLKNLRQICSRNGWTFRNPGGDEPKIDRNNDMNNFYASATVTVGDSLCLNKEKSLYWSDRVPEATGRNGLLIMPEIEALDDIYNGYLPMYRWGDWSDLENIIGYYLSQDQLRDKVKDEAWRITKDNHTYVNRAETIIKAIF